MTDAWDPSIPSHKELAREIEFGSGIPSMRPRAQARAALLSVGFVIEHDEDLAERNDEVPWYYPLEGDLRKAQTLWDYVTVFRISRPGRIMTRCFVATLELVGLLPKGTWDISKALEVAARSLVKGGQTKVRSFLQCNRYFVVDGPSKLFTPMYLVICKKPL